MLEEVGGLDPGGVETIYKRLPSLWEENKFRLNNALRSGDHKVWLAVRPAYDNGHCERCKADPKLDVI